MLVLLKWSQRVRGAQPIKKQFIGCCSQQHIWSHATCIASRTHLCLPVLHWGCMPLRHLVGNCPQQSLLARNCFAIAEIAQPISISGTLMVLSCQFVWTRSERIQNQAHAIPVSKNCWQLLVFCQCILLTLKLSLLAWLPAFCLLICKQATGPTKIVCCDCTGGNKSKLPEEQWELSQRSENFSYIAIWIAQNKHLTK